MTHELGDPALGDPALDDTVVAAPAPVRRPSDADLDDDTVPTTRFASEVVQRLPQPAPAARPARSAPLRLVLPGGESVPIDSTVLLGRKPSVPRVSADPSPRLVALASPSREVSATHAELRPVGDTVVVSDLRSTNGTVVTVPGSDPRVLFAGESAVVTPGSVVDLGDGNVLRIHSAALGAAAGASGADGSRA